MLPLKGLTNELFNAEHIHQCQRVVAEAFQLNTVP